jgi:Flp pilus assembly protein TadG
MADARGTVMVEFAMVAPILVLMLVFIMELGFDLFAQEALDYGLQTAARAIQTGQAQSTTTASAFKTKYLCPALNLLLPCASVAVNVLQVVGDYYTSGNSWTIPTNTAGQLNTTGYQYCPGLPNSLMRVQALYTGPTALGLLLPAMATPTATGPVHDTLSSVAFINENFPVTAAQPAGC